MKTFITLFFLFISYTSTAQYDRFTASLRTEPNAYSDGFNMGGAVEYQMRKMYLKAQFFYFPNLRGNTYFDYEATLIGFHDRRFPFEQNRVYGGFKAGVIHRFNNPYPKVGFEIGWEHYFSDHLFMGIEPSYDYRTDGKGEDSGLKPYWRMNCAVKIGIAW